jgi:putative Mg2+ transporter-C (MgtC) family protein
MIASATTALLAAPATPSVGIPSHWDAVARIALAWALTFVLGFERQLRGAMAGDRTFSMLGAATALIGVLSANGATTILAGAVTGIGFIGGGLCFRQTVDKHEVLHGITTAASIFACAAIGAACGLGLVKESIAATVATLLTLELRHVPLLRALDARRWDGLVQHDEHVAHHFFKSVCRDPDHHHDHSEARVATAATADSDAVVLLNPRIDPAIDNPTGGPVVSPAADLVAVAQQAAALTAATVDTPVPSGAASSKG